MNVGLIHQRGQRIQMRWSTYHSRAIFVLRKVSDTRKSMHLLKMNSRQSLSAHFLVSFWHTKAKSILWLALLIKHWALLVTRQIIIESLVATITCLLQQFCSKWERFVRQSTMHLVISTRLYQYGKIFLAQTTLWFRRHCCLAQLYSLDWIGTRLRWRGIMRPCVFKWLIVRTPMMLLGL